MKLNTDRIMGRLDEKAFFGISIGIFAVWMLLTFLLEGLRNTLNDGSGIDRLLYAGIANILVGSLVTGLLVISGYKAGILDRKDLGFSGIKRTSIMIVVAITVGTLIFVMQGVPSSDPVVLINGFAQVFPTTLAEVMVCWVFIGSAGKAIMNKLGKVPTTLILMTISSTLFGLYHFAHSAPFNTIGMVFVLTVIGVLTSLVYYLGKDIFSTLIFHNLMATFGVVGALEDGALTDLKIPLMVLMGASLIVLAYYTSKFHRVKIAGLKEVPA